MVMRGEPGSPSCESVCLVNILLALEKEWGLMCRLLLEVTRNRDKSNRVRDLAVCLHRGYHEGFRESLP